MTKLFVLTIAMTTISVRASVAIQTLDLQRLLDDARHELGAPGAILGVHVPRGSTRVFTSGVADLESARPIEQTDAYFLGSISKTYTAVVVMRLLDDGHISLEDPLSKFLPSFPRGDAITIRQLLDHTSGLKDVFSYIYFRPNRDEMIRLVTKSWTQRELRDLSERFGHWFAPGENWAYSSTNYFVLGVVIEQVTGASLAEAYATLIFEPLGLNRTWLTWHEPARSSLPITGYMAQIEAWEHSAMFGSLGPTSVLDISPVEWGAGGLAGPATEVVQFMSALMGGQLVTPSTLDTMLQFRITPPLGLGSGTPDVSSGYGLGLVRMERAGYTAIGHGGLFTGHTAGVWHLPSCGVTITLFFNRGFIGQRHVLDRVVSAITEQHPDAGDCAATPP